MRGGGAQQSANPCMLPSPSWCAWPVQTISCCQRSTWPDKPAAARPAPLSHTSVKRGASAAACDTVRPPGMAQAQISLRGRQSSKKTNSWLFRVMGRPESSSQRYSGSARDSHLGCGVVEGALHQQGKVLALHVGKGGHVYHTTSQTQPLSPAAAEKVSGLAHERTNGNVEAAAMPHSLCSCGNWPQYALKTSRSVHSRGRVHRLSQTKRDVPPFAQHTRLKPTNDRRRVAWPSRRVQSGGSSASHSPLGSSTPSTSENPRNDLSATVPQCRFYSLQKFLPELTFLVRLWSP